MTRVCVAIASILALAACKPAKTAAEALDTTEQVDCVKQASTRAEADACRAEVKARFAAPKDAGVE